MKIEGVVKILIKYRGGKIDKVDRTLDNGRKRTGTH